MNTKTALTGIVVASFAASLAACASVGVTRIKPATAKAETCNIDVYTEDSEVDRPVEVVCMLDSKTGSKLFDDKTVAGAINEAKPEACKCGGDAIIVKSSSRTGVSMTGWGEGMATLKVVRYVGEATAKETAEQDEERPANASSKRRSIADESSEADEKAQEVQKSSSKKSSKRRSSAEDSSAEESSAKEEERSARASSKRRRK